MLNLIRRIPKNKLEEVYRKRLFPAEVEQTLREMDADRATRSQPVTESA